MKSAIKVLVVLLAMTGLPALAQKYPTKPVRMVISFPPGSATDIVGRLYTQKLTEYWGQNVLADNRGGAGGIDRGFDRRQGGAGWLHLPDSFLGPRGQSFPLPRTCPMTR